MLNKVTNGLLLVILALLLFNLGLTVVMYERQAIGMAANGDQPDRLDLDIAEAWGDKVADLYNQRDHQALHVLFHQQARVKIGQQQFATQMEKLQQLFGIIEDHAYVNSSKIGAKGGESYYELFFNVRVSAKQNPATMKLSVVVDNDVVSLYGLSINASESLE